MQWRDMMRQRWEKVKAFWDMFRSMPEVEIHLMKEKTEGTDPFFAHITDKFYRRARQRHKRFPIFRQMMVGVALSDLSNGFEGYLKQIESSARRNYKKAKRNGFTFRQIDFNQHLDDIWAIRGSAQVRQGKMPEDFVRNKPKPISDPQAETNIHGYTYFGVLDAEGVLVAYAGCLQAGEALMIEHIYGHADYQSFGVVPMLFISLAEHAIEHYPYVKYMGYGTYFGASETMRRFKKKFSFLPHRVKWILSGG